MYLGQTQAEAWAIFSWPFGPWLARCVAQCLFKNYLACNKRLGSYGA